MARYHVNTNTGNTGTCKAAKGKCPFGGETGEDNHYSSAEEATQAAEKLMAETYTAINTAYRKKDTSKLGNLNRELKKRILKEASEGSVNLHPSVVAKVFSKDNDELIRKNVAENFKSHKILREMSNDESAAVRNNIAKAINNPEILKSLSEDPNLEVRLSVAGNPKTPEYIKKKNLSEARSNNASKENNSTKEKISQKSSKSLKGFNNTTKPKLTEKELKLFTDGDCWVLAKELYDRKIGSLVGIAPRNDPEAFNHLAIRLPNNKILDANGISSEKEFFDKWSPHAFGKPGTASLVNYNIKNESDWHELSSDLQEERLSTSKELKDVADKIQSWGKANKVL